MTKVILISQFPLPYSKIGSWTNMYKNYLTADSQVDIIVCPQPEFRFDHIEYSIVKKSVFTKVKNKFVQPFSEYMDALDKVLSKHDKYVIKIIDNTGIVGPLHDFLKRKGLRDHCTVLFFLHGFAPFYASNAGGKFFNAINEMVLLTKESYLAHKSHYVSLPIKVSILHNGINTQKFFPIQAGEKLALRKKLGLNAKHVFVWCSQDRPKKGLMILLEAWKQVYKPNHDMELMIIGCKPKQPIDGVKYIGVVPNDSLPQYFQSADVLLFSSLCHEGFPLTITEALHCGCYCIASALGGIPEVLQYGNFGKLIAEPHFVSEWSRAIESYLVGDTQKTPFPTELYSTQQWNHHMNLLLFQAKASL